VIVGFPNGRSISHILQMFVNEFLPVISMFIGRFLMKFGVEELHVTSTSSYVSVKSVQKRAYIAWEFK
jgi:hypothetical protein